MAQSTETALAELLVHSDWIRQLALTLVRDAARAEDVAQETLVAALHGAPREASHLRAWLARVVRNLALQSRRSETRRLRREASVARIEATADHATLLAEAEAHRASDQPRPKNQAFRYTRKIEGRYSLNSRYPRAGRAAENWSSRR